jgi:hypothetical protein
MNLRRATVVTCVLALFTLISPPAQAGRMKDVQFSHLEALAEYLFGNTDTDSLVIRKTGFVPAPQGFFIAISSEVQVYSAAQSSFQWETCTTFFVKEPATTAEPEKISVTKVSCELS